MECAIQFFDYYLFKVNLLICFNFVFEEHWSVPYSSENKKTTTSSLLLKISLSNLVLSLEILDGRFPLHGQ